MKKMARKLFACLLAVMLAFNMIPLVVFAAGTEGNEGGNVVGADGTQSSGSVQLNLGANGPLVYNIGGEDSVKLSDIFAYFGIDGNYYDENEQEYGMLFFRVSLYDENEKFVGNFNNYYGTYYTYNYDVEITGLSKIPYQQKALINVRQYIYSGGKYSPLTFPDGSKRIYLYQDTQPVDRAYRALLSDMTLTVKDGTAINAGDVASVNFIDRKNTDGEIKATAVTGKVDYTCYNGTDTAVPMSKEVDGNDFLLESREPITATEGVILTLTDGRVVRANIPEYTYYVSAKNFTLRDIYQQIGLKEDHHGLLLDTSDSTHQMIEVSMQSSVGDESYEEKTTLSLVEPEYPMYLWLRDITTGKSFYINFEEGTVPGEQVYQDAQFLYAMNEDGETLTIAALSGAYDGNGTIVIRSVSGEIDGATYPVTAVADSAFKNENGIAKVVFENDSDMTVFGSAFQNMKALQSVEINGKGTVFFGKDNWDYVFGYDTALKTVTGTGTASFRTMGMFQGCSALETVAVSHILLISRNTFIDNKHELTVEADRIDRIDYQGFNRCALTRLTVKNGCPSIENYWGGGVCDNEADLTVQFNGNITQGIGGAFSLKEGKKLFFKAENTEPISICDWAFSDSPVVSVEITGPVSTVGGSAFNNCKSLETFRIDGSVTSFGGWAFNWCEALKTFEVTGNVGTLSGHAFNECDALESVLIGGNVTAISSCAMYHCDGLKAVRINGDVGSIAAYGIDGCDALESLIVMGKTGSVATYAAKSPAMRVLVLKGGVSSMDYYICGTQAFSDEDSFIYVGSVGGRGSVNSYAFGNNSTYGNAYFNTSDDKLDAALNGYSLVIGDYHCSDQSYDPDFYVRIGAKYGYGSSASDAYNNYNGVMYSLYNRTRSTVQFRKDCAAAGVEDLGLEFSGDMKPGFNGFTLHILADKDTNRATLPADLYGDMLDYYGLSAQDTFGDLKAIVFESDAEEITIPDGALKRFPNLESVTVRNADAKVTIGVDAFSGTKVNTICTAEQTVAGKTGKVTLAGNTAPIGTALVMSTSEDSYDEAVLAAIRADNVFGNTSEDQIRIKYFDLSLAAPDGTAVNQPARVRVTQNLEIFGVDTIAPKAFAFFHIKNGTAMLMTNEFSADLTRGTMTYEFDADGFSPYAAAYIPGAVRTSDGVYTYLADDEGNASVTGYDTGFTGDVLDIPDTTEIDGKTYRVVGIAADALANPPEGITIRSVEFHNTDTLLIGSNAMGGLGDVTAISFAGDGDVVFRDGSAFTGTGSGTVDVRMPNGLTAKTEDGSCGDVFSGITDGYALTVDNISSIPDNAFKGDTKLNAVTVVSALANISPFKPQWANSYRGNFTDCAIGTSAFEGASNLVSFTAENAAGKSIAIGNEAFKDCASLTELNIADKLSGIGEHALSNTGFTTLKLYTEDAEFGKEALAYNPKLEKLEIVGGVYGTGKAWLGGSGDNATKLKQLVFDGKVVPQLYNSDIRGERLSVLIFKNGGSSGITEKAIYTEGPLEAESLTVYVDGDYNDNPYIRADGFPGGQKVRIYLNLPISNTEAYQSNDLIRSSNITDLAYSVTAEATDLYVDTTLADEDCASTKFNSFEKAREAASDTHDSAAAFRQYFREAGYDPGDLEFAENTSAAVNYSLHVIGGTTQIDKSFAGDPKLTSVDINVNGNIAIEDGAFKDCENLSSLTFTKVHHTDIGKGAFENCTSLEEFRIRNKYNLDIRENAFRNCANLKTLNIYGMDQVTIGAYAFAGTSPEEISITNSYKDIIIEDNAFRGVTSISSVVFSMLYSSYGITIGENAFADCGDMDKVLLKNSTAPTIGTNAFTGTIGTLRIDGGSTNVADGAFSGGNAYIDGGSTFTRNLADQVGNFRTIILTAPQTISAEAQVFSSNPELKYVYLGDKAGTKDIGGEIFAGMPEDAEAYVAKKSTDFTSKAGGAPTREDGILRFLGNTDFKYIDGKTTKTQRDGSEQNPFKTYEEARASVAASNADGRPESGKTYYYEEIAKAIRAASAAADVSISENSIRFAIPGTDTVFLVKGTITVNDTQTWDSPEGTTITLIRNEGFKDVMVQLNTKGNLTLTNVVLDGVMIEANNPLIKTNGGILTIADGAVICNNNHTSYSYPTYAGGIYSNGTVYMTGGTISGNYGMYGGGIQIIGSSGVFYMSGGVIENNTANDSTGQKSYGGGVNVGSGAKMYLSGGEIRKNKSTGGYNQLGGDGGGISVGADVSGMSQQSKLYMTGGVISGNSAEHDGGGVYIQDNCEGHFDGGVIENNTAYYGVFGGGGIYVNGKRDVKDGIAYLKNVLITGNSADEEGGGLAGCSTSTSTVYALNGGAIYGNSAGDGSDIYTDTIQRSSFPTGYMKGSVSPYMFDGTPANWSDSRTGERLTNAQLSNIRNLIHESRVTLTANPDDNPPTSAPMIIRNNTSHTKGGGIGSNGSVIIGGEPETKDVSWTPEANKIIWNRDMKENEVFTFSVFEEIASQGQNYLWTRYEDKYIEEGSVTGGLDGQAKAISFGKIDLGTVSAKDLGKTRTFLVAENEPEDKTVSDTGTYLAFVVAICTEWDEEAGREVLSANLLRTEKGKLLTDGTYAYDNIFEGEVIATANASHNFGRIRSKVDNSNNVFHNYFGKTTVFADKMWLNYDGSDTPPEGAKVVFELYADDMATGKTVELDGIADENGETIAWTALWTNLDAYRLNSDGEPYKESEDDPDFARVAYSVKEVSVTMPEGNASIYAEDETLPTADGISILNRQLTGELKVSKTVESETETHHELAFSFTVILSDQHVNGQYGDMTFKDGVAEFTLKDGESATATGLPAGIRYTAAETPDETFTTAMTGEQGIITETLSEADFVNRYEPVTGDLKVSKIVISEEQAHHERAFRFTVTLDDRTVNGTYGDMTFKDGAAEFTLKDGESATATGLPAGIRYTAAETPDETFTTTMTDEQGIITETLSEAGFVNRYEPMTGDLKVSKIVISEEPAHHERAFRFTVTLDDRTVNGTYGDMTFKDGVAEFTLKDGESATAKGLPVGTAYTVEEAPEEPFSTSMTGEKGTISETLSSAQFANSYTPEPPPPPPAVRKLEVMKIWDDAENQDGIRPEQISVKLLANGEETLTVTLSEVNGWSASTESLPVEQDGTAITYEWVEEEVAGYILTVSQEDDRTILTNTHIPEVTEASVRKVWNDNNNAQGARPAKIIMTLSNGQQAELNEANGWSATISDLPAYSAGEPVTYTWTEQEVIGYRLESTVTEGTVTTFTNRVIIVPETPTETRKPRVPKEPLTPFEEYDTPLGVDVMINHVGDCFD